MSTTSWPLPRGLQSAIFRVAIDSQQATKALRAAHAAFWLSPQTFSIGVIGPGHVGEALLDQLCTAQQQLLSKANPDLRLRAIVSRRRMLLDERGLGATGATLRRRTRGGRSGCLYRTLQVAHLPHAVIIDCSGSAEVADRYADWLAAGIHVVTPNKQAGSGPCIATTRFVQQQMPAAHAFAMKPQWAQACR